MKFRRLALALAAMVAVGPALAQQLVMSRATGATGLFTLNTATGVATAIPNTATLEFSGLGSQAGGEVVGYLTGSASSGRRITLATGATATLPAAGANPLNGLDCNPSTGDCWAADNGNFNRINPSTGAVVALAAAPTDVEGLAYAPGGTSGYVYGVGGANLMRYDIAGNTWSTIGAIGFNVDEAGLAFDPVGNVLYLAPGNAAESANLYTVNTTTGAATLVGATGLGTSGIRRGLAWVGAAPTPTGVVISDTTPVPVLYAKEINASVDAPVTLTNGSGDLNLSTVLGHSLSSGEVRYARIECPAHIIFAAGSAAVASSAANMGAINGLGTNAIFFSITATNANTTATSTITVNGNRSISSSADATCTYGLYDQPSQALAGGTTGRIATRSGSYITFNTSYTLTGTALGAVANVQAAPSFTRFVSATPTNSVDRAAIGTATFALRSPAPRIADGSTVTLATLLAAGSHHSVAGDFSAAANADGSYTGAALNRVYFSSTADCSVVSTPASTITASSARFDTGAAAVAGLSLCYAPRTGVAIPASTYTQTFNAVSAAAATYTVNKLGPLDLGSITRNGTQLQASFVQVPAGWLSRIVLTNTGSTARPYTITALTEDGSTVVLGTAATGSVPARGTIVLNTADIASFTGVPRGALNVNVAGPDNSIQGLYQIVNATTGAVSNTVMVRPGTN